jgi:hypothetical protein
MHDCEGRVHNLENGSGNCEEREGGACSDGGHQLAAKDLPHPGGCGRQPFEDEAQGLE